jgi:protein TonB
MEALMNIERYKLPAIIAASLHGALFLIIPDPTVGHATEPVDVPNEWEKPAMPDPLPVDLTPPEEHESIVPAGGGKPLPSMPDVPQLLTATPLFTVPVMQHMPSLDPVKSLAEYRGEPVGPGVGPGDLANVGIPGIANLDRVPRAMVQPSPSYPSSLRNDGVSGSVTVEFVVDTAGRVITAEPVKWTHREFVEPAVRAVLRWRFEPGTLDGRKVRFRMAVPIEFAADR